MYSGRNWCYTEETMADYEHNRRGCTDDGGDICAILKTKICLRNKMSLSLALCAAYVLQQGAEEMIAK